MSLAVLELNDQALLIRSEEGAVHAEPGFASLSADGIVTGEAARASAWRQPQHSYNQYWAQLNQSPLAATERHARHHADIAYAQLRHVWTQAGTPDSMIVLAPGSFTDGQLSLLLGMLAALPCKARAVMDSGLASCLQAERETLYVDMQLHQTVATLCRPGGQTLEVAEQEIFPQFGVLPVHNTVARHISNLLIDSARYDPLHASNSEQEIFDHMLSWLERLRWEDEVPAKLSIEQGELPFILRRAELQRLLAERLKSMRAFFARYPDAALSLAHGSAMLTGLAGEMNGAAVAGQAATVDYVLSHQSVLLAQVDGLYRVRVLEPEREERSAPRLNGRLATHLLLGDQAVPLHRPVNIRVAAGRVEQSGRMDEAAGMSLVLRDRTLQLLHNATGLVAELPAHCAPGETVRLGEHQLKLIEVRDG